MSKFVFVHAVHTTHLRRRIERLRQAVAVEVIVAPIAVAHEDEIVTIVLAANHAGVLARSVLSGAHATIAVEPLGHLKNGEGGMGRGTRQRVCVTCVVARRETWAAQTLEATAVIATTTGSGCTRKPLNLQRVSWQCS